MRHSRWLAPWKNSMERPVIYHCVTRVVERRLAFGPDEKEQFRTYMRMYENFSGCRVLSYCLMCNHIHLLLEVPPMKVGGLSDDELLKRLRAIYSEVFVAEVAKELVEARQQVKDGLAEESVVVARIHERFTYRMHDLSEFMRTLLLRFSRWFNKRHERTGALWESRFKSILVEEGVASKTMVGYWATSSHLAAWRCSCMTGLPVVSDLVSSTMRPVVAAGAAGSKLTVPLTPLAVPEMASSGASSLNWIAFTPLGSLKSKEVGAAYETAAKQANAASAAGRRTAEARER